MQTIVYVSSSLFCQAIRWQVLKRQWVLACVIPKNLLAKPQGTIYRHCPTTWYWAPVVCLFITLPLSGHLLQLKWSIPSSKSPWKQDHIDKYSGWLPASYTLKILFTVHVYMYIDTLSPPHMPHPGTAEWTGLNSAITCPEYSVL